MGAVWLAERADGMMKRRVALLAILVAIANRRPRCTIHNGMDGRVTVVAR